MPINDEGTSFWSSLPGVLKGVAAIITATTGLITVLYATGYFEERKKGHDDAPGLHDPVSLSGQWDATETDIPDTRYKRISCLELTQSGNELKGIVKYSEVRYASGKLMKLSDRPSGTFKGLVRGSDIEVNYVNSEGLSGTAHLSISTDGNSVNGSWASSTTNDKGTWIWKRRDSACSK